MTVFMNKQIVVASIALTATAAVIPAKAGTPLYISVQDV
jgi:hypothetical protein